ncbi:hypothetical protein VTJ04DRAFT_2857 [Mycothermus thermophilus]|uniref:uncharacterized protein n=1 Tax=Humicola insolens TaxID=85995 RepID=UPI0037445A5A
MSRVGAPFPNLSLNMGIQQPKRRVLRFAAAFGVLLQFSVFIYASWVTYYNTSFYVDDGRPHTWSFVVAMAGTLLLKNDDRTSAHIYWVQPGDQRVADQQFPAFAYYKPATTYTTSSLLACVASTAPSRSINLAAR